MKKINVGSDFSGVGAFDQALMLLGIPYNTIFSCDMDKYARETYIANYGEPPYYPKDVYDREIPTEPLDVYMTSPPCQGFSMSGGRGGSILFHNSHEFIKKNNPRFFIFENVKGLLSHDRDSKDSKEIGKTFQTWINYLGGKSVNGNPVLFPMEEAVHYHIYWTVLNTKHFGIPQNRERIFIIGIRDDKDNSFRWPQGVPLLRKLKDVLEEGVNDKYYLSVDNIDKLIQYDKRNKEKGNGFGAKFHDPDKDNMSALKLGGGGCDDLVKVSKEVRTEDSKKKRRETGTNDFRGKEIEFRYQDHMNTITASLTNDHFVKTDKIRRLTPRECFRLQGFPDTFKFVVSDTQLYKQAGNSITREVLAAIINKLNLKP